MAGSGKAYIAVLLGAAFLSLNAGIFANHQGLWPTGYYHQAYKAYKAHNEKVKRIRTALKILPSGPSTVTKMVLTPQRFDGYRFVCRKDAIELLDEEGRRKHGWHLPFRKAWPKIEHIESPIPDALIECFSAHLYPNGDVVEVYQASNDDTPYGYGMAKMDKNSRPIWTYSKNVHHDVFVAEDGRIYTLTQKFYDNPDYDVPLKTDRVLADSIAILDPDGKELDEINILQAFMGSPYEKEMQDELANQHLAKLAFDITHTNSVMALDEKMAPAFPMFKPGYILVSIKHLDMIAVIDPAKRKVVWAMHGDWSRQHQARFQADGTIMFFNNHYIDSGKKHSRLVVVDPKKKEIIWQFVGHGKTAFFTTAKGSGETLPNGNIVITSSDDGYIFEINPKGEMLWSYDINTFVASVQNVDKDYFTPAFCKDIHCLPRVGKLTLPILGDKPIKPLLHSGK